MAGMPPMQSHGSQTISSIGYSHPIGPPFMLGMQMQSGSDSISFMQSMHSYHLSHDECFDENVLQLATPYGSPPPFDESFMVRIKTYVDSLLFLFLLYILFIICKA